MNNLAFNKEISVKDLMIKDWVAIKKETFKEYANASQCKSCFQGNQWRLGWK